MQWKKITNEALIVLLGQSITIAATVLGIKFATDLFDTNALGIALLALTITGLVGQLITGGISAGLQRQYACSVSEIARNDFFCSSKRVIWYTSAVATITTVLLGVCALLIGAMPSYVTILLLAAQTAASSSNTLHLGLFAAARMRKTVAIASAIEAGSRIGMLPLAVNVFGCGHESFLIAYLAPSLLIAVPLKVRWDFITGSVRKYTFSIAENVQEQTSKIIRFAWPYTTWGILTAIHQMSDRWALEAFGSATDIAIYSVAFQLGYSPIIVLTNVVTSFLSPIFFQMGGSETPGALKSVNSLTRKFGFGIFVLTSIATIVFSLYGGIFAKNFLNARYVESIPLISILIASGGAFAIGQTMTIAILSFSSSRIILVPKIATALIGTLLNILGAYIYGPIGVALGSLVFSVVFVVWMLMINLRHEHKELIQKTHVIAG